MFNKPFHQVMEIKRVVNGNHKDLYEVEFDFVHVF